MIKIKITDNISDIKNTNNEIKEVRYNDMVVWGGGELIVKITFFDRRNFTIVPNAVYVYSDNPGLAFKSKETRDIKTISKNGKNYINIKIAGITMSSFLIIKEKIGNWQKTLINKDDFLLDDKIFEVELVNASNNKEYIIEFNK